MNMYYEISLFKFYNKILFELDFKVTSKYLFFDNIKESSPLMLDGREIVLIDETKEFATNNNEIIFNPIEDNELSCSFLILNDSIHHKLAVFINKIFEIVIEMKLNIYRGRDIAKFSDYMKSSPNIDKSTLYKWKNIFSIVNLNLTSKNIISFSFEYSSDYQSAYVKFDYPLYNYLFQIHNNEIFGINFSNSEIELFKKIYEIFIINIVEERFKTPIDVPQDSNKASKLCIFLKFYMIFKELLEENYQLKFGTYKFLKDKINSLNEYNYIAENFYNLEKLEKIKKLDQEVYENELKIREESNANLLLLKDNIVQEKQLAVQNDESLEVDVLKDFSDKEKFVDNLTNLVNFLTDDKAIEKYKKSLNELILLGREANYITQQNSEKEYYQKLDRENKLSSINYWQNVALNIINKFGICLWQDFNTQDYSFRTSINNKEKSGNKKEIGKIISKALNEELNNIIKDDFRNKRATCKFNPHQVANFSL